MLETHVHSWHRTPRRGSVALLVGALLLVLALAGCGSSGSTTSLLAASVDGHDIALSEYTHLVAVYKASANRQGQSANTQSPTGRTSLAQVERFSLDTLVNLQLLREELAREGITVAAKDQQTAENSLNGQIATQRANLKKDPNNPSNAGLQEQLDALTPDVVHVLSEQQAVEAALAAHGKAPAAHVRAILVKTQQEAQQIQQQAQGGTDFGTLAKQHSLDTQSGAQGGELGTIFPGQISADFDKAVFAPKTLPATDYVTTPIQGQYAIFEVTKRVPTALASLNSQQTEQGVITGWLTAVLRPQAKIHEYVTIN